MRWKWRNYHKAIFTLKANDTQSNQLEDITNFRTTVSHYKKLKVQFVGNVPQFRSSAPLGQSFLPSHRRAKGTHEPSRQVKSDAGQGATIPPTPRRHRHVYTHTHSHIHKAYTYSRHLIIQN